MKQFLLIDCNNFFVSCERLFNPALLGKPVVVLSNNDGCVISRSNEAKALGIKMGQAAFECTQLFKKHSVAVFSSNFALYADISARIMYTLAQHATDIEIYSIDEAFLFIPPGQDPVQYARQLRTVVKQHTGIPISIGIGPTKTLAKVANKLAKKDPQGVRAVPATGAIDDILSQLPVADVWGVGRQYSKKLIAAGIINARDLKYASDVWIKKNLTIVGLKMVQELRGISCLDLVDGPDPKKSITVSRTFGRPIASQQELSQAVARYIERAAQKLRQEQLLTGLVSVWIATSRYHEHQYYVNSISCTLPLASNYTPDLLAAASHCLSYLYKAGYQYKKAGVYLSDMIPVTERQLSLLSRAPDTHKQDSLMKIYDIVHSRFGKVLLYAASGVDDSWRAKRQFKSPHYTTNWHELLTITI